MTMSASQTVAASSTIRAPAALYISSVNPLPTPAPPSTKTVCPAAVSCLIPAGVAPTRYSFALISLGTPIRTSD
jgi:hypothetical protein